MNIKATLILVASYWVLTPACTADDYPAEGQPFAPHNAELIETGWLRALNEELGAYIHALNLHQVNVVGHSLGGFLGMAVAIENADRVHKVVSIDGVPYLAPIFTRNPNTQVDDMRTNAHLSTQYNWLFAWHVDWIRRWSCRLDIRVMAKWQAFLGLRNVAGIKIG